MIKALAIALMANVAVVNAATFDGYQCTDDCSGHQAGYDWAQEKDIDDISSCTTASQSFNEGCESFVNGGAGSITADDEDEDDQLWQDDDEDEDEDN